MKPGFCPYLDDNQKPHCPKDSKMCEADQDCNGEKKCCKFSGCGQRCVKPLEFTGKYLKIHC